MPVVNTRQVNGVVRTSEPVWSNLERMAEAMTSWFTYDVHTGLYSWVINEAGNSAASLSEADIIGPIQISGSGLNNLYNSIEIEYPNTEIRDQPHYVRLELPSGLRNAYEPDNTLQITSEFINNQPQAEYSAMVNLKQSRLDRTITINMDYTKINIRAGDIIDVTSDTYGWTNKEFRVMRVREIEGDDGSLRLEFNCSEYDDTIYDGTWAEFLVGGAPGIISLGSIGVPGTPTVATITVDSLPQQRVTTTVPTGIVDRMQFWAGNVASTGNVNNTTFELYGTVASTDANAFVNAGNVSFTTTSLRNGTWAWKTRATNVNGTGPFSALSGNVVYVRNQVPDAIGNSTGLLDGAGNIITTLLGVTALVKGLDTYMNGNSNLANAVGGQIDSSGGAAGASLLQYYIENSGNVITGGSPANVTPQTTSTTLSFVAPSDGWYRVDTYVNFGRATNATDSSRNITNFVYTGGTYGAGNLVANLSISTSTANVNVYQDLDTHIVGYISAGTYHCELGYYTQTADLLLWTLSVQGPFTSGTRGFESQ